MGCGETGILYAMLQAISLTSVGMEAETLMGVISQGLETGRMKWAKCISVYKRHPPHCTASDRALRLQAMEKISVWG